MTINAIVFISIARKFKVKVAKLEKNPKGLLGKG